MLTRETGELRTWRNERRYSKYIFFFLCAQQVHSNKFQKYTTVNYNDVVSKLTELPVSDNDLVLETLSRFAILSRVLNDK